MALLLLLQFLCLQLQTMVLRHHLLTMAHLLHLSFHQLILLHLLHHQIMGLLWILSYLHFPHLLHQNLWSH